MKHLLLTLTLLTVPLSAQTGAVLKLRSDNTLTEALATGSKTLTISATGTLTWTSGATLSGASDFRTAAGLGTAAVLDTGTDSGDIPLLGAGGDLTVTGVLRSQLSSDAAQGGQLGVDSVFFSDVGDSSFWQILTLTTPTANRTHTLPDRSGTLLHADGNGSALTALNASNLASGTVPAARLGSGTADSTTYLRGDNTWQTISSGLTIGTTAITSGTSGRVLYNNGGVVGELTTTGSGDVVRATSPTLTTPALGVATADDVSTTGRFYGASQPGYPQFTETGYAGNGMRVYSDRLDFWISSTPIFTVYATDVDFGVAGMAWGGNAKLFGGLDGTGRLVQRVGTNAQAFSVAKTYTSFTNKEEVELGWASDVAHVWTLKGSGGGTARDLVLGRDSTAKLTLGANTTDHAQPVKAAAYTVATLPAAATVGAYSIAAVSDADTPVVGSTVTGGGSAKALVCSNGTNWLVIAVL
jgi:hypothetical protein